MPCPQGMTVFVCNVVWSDRKALWGLCTINVTIVGPSDPVSAMPNLLAQDLIVTMVKKSPVSFTVMESEIASNNHHPLAKVLVGRISPALNASYPYRYWTASVPRHDSRRIIS